MTQKVLRRAGHWTDPPNMLQAYSKNTPRAGAKISAPNKIQTYFEQLSPEHEMLGAPAENISKTRPM